MIKVDWIMFAVVLSILSTSLILFSRIRGRRTEKIQAVNDFDEEDLRELFNRIVKLIDEEKYYLNKNLKLSDLAGELSDNNRMVSKAINRYGNGNFNKFINAFRVDYSKEILIGGKHDHYTIEAIAEESGFSNKVSFYNAFKSETGMSPTQYRDLKQSKLQ